MIEDMDMKYVWTVWLFLCRAAFAAAIPPCRPCCCPSCSLAPPAPLLFCLAPTGLGKTTLIRSLVSTPGERLQVNEAGGRAMSLMMACTA